MDPSNHSELRLEHLSVRYDQLVAVRDINMTIRDEIVVLFGPSGCGKTSILKAILGVADSKMRVEGAIQINNHPITTGDGAIGMVFQGSVVPGWMTTFDVCRMGCRIRSLPKPEQRARVLDILERFNISHMMDRYPCEMSSGERQRVSLAAALVNTPKVLLLDEPTTYLDGVARSRMWEFIEQTVRPLGIPTILVSHDPVEAVLLGDRICILDALASVRGEVSLPFPHPRGPELFRKSDFWDIFQQIKENEVNIRR